MVPRDSDGLQRCNVANERALSSLTRKTRDSSAEISNQQAENGVREGDGEPDRSVQKELPKGTSKTGSRDKSRSNSRDHAKETSWENDHLHATVYTDVPARVSVLPEGRFMMPEHCSVFLAWARRQIQIPTTSTPLSIRWVGNGQRFFHVQGTRSVVDDNSYLLLNSGQESASEIDSLWAVRCYTVCFRPGMVEEVLGALVTPEDRLLDEPESVGHQPVNFLEKVYPHHEGISTVLGRLATYTSSSTAGSSPMEATPSHIPAHIPSYGWFEDQFHELLVQMLAVHRNVRREIEALPGVRATTRVELYRRLHRAREFMEASLEQPLTIAEIAQAAWFSPFHFLRLFKQAFGETPHQYLIRRRLDRAQSLLVHSDMPVTEICYAVGFESPGSFSGLFHRQIGQTPMQFRRNGRH